MNVAYQHAEHDCAAPPTARDADLYLRPEAKLEPLAARWPLWPHLIPPAQYAMNLAFRQLPSLRSFVASPSVHASAARDPRLFGGPFVALSERDTGAVKRLIEDTSRKCERLLAFAKDFRALNDQLQRCAAGYSLDDYYRDLPPSLAGLVELVYDLNNHPSIRLIEALTYESELDSRDTQSFCLHLTPDAQRPFFMSTPMLDAPNRLFFDLPYTSAIIDRLATTRITAGVSRDLREFLDAKHCSLAFQGQLFTDTPPHRNGPQYGGADVRIRYFGHACVLIQTATVSVLIDPSTAWQRDGSAATLTFSDLPDYIDYVVITHCHQDHCVPETLLQLRARVGVVVVPAHHRGSLADPSMKLILQRLGYARIVAMDYFEALEIPGGEIVSLPFIGEHGGLDIASKHSVAVRLMNRRALFLVDSDAVDPRLWARVADRIGAIDVLFIGMECRGAPMSWLYGALASTPLTRANDESRRFSGSDCDRAWSAVQALKPQRVYVYAMGQEPWMRHLMGLEYQSDSIQLREAQRFIERCNSAGTPAQRLNGCRDDLLC